MGFLSVLLSTISGHFKVYFKRYIYLLLRKNMVIKKKVPEDYRKAAKTPLIIHYAKWNDCILQIRKWQTQHLWCISDFWFCKSGNWNIIRCMLFVIKVLAAFMGNTMSNNVSSITWKLVSMEHQQLLVLHVRLLNRDLVVVIHNHSNGCLYWQNSMRHTCCPISRISVNGASTISGLTCWVISVALDHRHLETKSWHLVHSDQQEKLPQQSPGQLIHISGSKLLLSIHEGFSLVNQSIFICKQ